MDLCEKGHICAHTVELLLLFISALPVTARADVQIVFMLRPGVYLITTGTDITQCTCVLCIFTSRGSIDFTATVFVACVCVSKCVSR